MHIRCQVCVYVPQIVCLSAIFSTAHAQQTPDAICTLDWVLTCSVTCSWALQSSGECVCHFEFTRYAGPKSDLQCIFWAEVCHYSLGRGLPLFAEPHYILRCHVCPNFIDLSGQCFLISPAVDSAYVGHCFATAHCAMIHFSVPFVTLFRWCQPFIDNSSFARDLEGGTVFVCPGLICACEPHRGTHKSVVNTTSNSRVLTDLLQRT